MSSIYKDIEIIVGSEKSWEDADRKTVLTQLITFTFLFCCAVLLVSCGAPSLEGKYVGTLPDSMDNHPRETILEFRSGGKVFISDVPSKSETVAGSYTVDGDKVSISVPPWFNIVLTRNSDGSLSGSGQGVTKFTKQ